MYWTILGIGYVVSVLMLVRINYVLARSERELVNGRQLPETMGETRGRPVSVRTGELIHHS